VDKVELEMSEQFNRIQAYSVPKMRIHDTHCSWKDDYHAPYEISEDRNSFHSRGVP